MAGAPRNHQSSYEDDDEEPTAKRPASRNTLGRPRPPALAPIPTRELIPIDVDRHVDASPRSGGELKSGIVRSSSPRIEVPAISLIALAPRNERSRPGLLIAAICIVGFALLAAGIALNEDALVRLVSLR